MPTPRRTASLAHVYKFGGTSVGTPQALRAAVDICAHGPRPLAVVVSAAGGITDLLLDATTSALEGRMQDAHKAVAAFKSRHAALIEGVVAARRTAPLLARVSASATELTTLLQGVLLLGELTPRTRDRVVSHGERTMAALFAALLGQARVNVASVDPLEVLHTTAQPAGLWPDLDACKRAANKVVTPLLKAGKVVIMPGFIARGPQGALVTLGRGGTDLSAATLGNALGAAAVTLWKDVPGLMTADPRHVPQARVIPALHYREAAELAYYGAKVLHPRTMVPLKDAGIPLYVRPTLEPSHAGTRIAGDVAPSAYPVRALTAFTDQALLSVEGNGMMGVPGMAARTFSALSQHGISVAMISQASSESSICLVVPQTEVDDAEAALRQALGAELAAGLVEQIGVEKDVAILAVVGMGMRGTPGTAARTLGALAAQRVNVLAMAQGSSELNITLAIHNKDVRNALGALHSEYRLDLTRALADPRGREASIIIHGLGQIGRTLVGQLDAQKRLFEDELGLNLRFVAVTDRSGARVRADGFAMPELLRMAAQKAKGQPLVKRRGSAADAAAKALRSEVFPHPLHTPIFVDLTADETFPLLMEGLKRGCHIVLANKKPLAVPQRDYNAMMALARDTGLSVRYEATVGAGLPVLDTLAKLRESGDSVQGIVGCFSGTLGFLMTQLEAGVPFSKAVADAAVRGFTEPDPREDLSGMDVARKALILARTLGHKLDMADIALEPLFPAELSKDDPKAFVRGLGALDAAYAKRVDQARHNGQVLRYVARVAAGGAIRVGLETVALSEPPARLQGTDNMVVLYTRRYQTNPLVVTGPGAGADVTAQGVLNDLIAIASGADRRPRTRRA